jgi:hypothetical protein
MENNVSKIPVVLVVFIFILPFLILFMLLKPVNKKITSFRQAKYMNAAVFDSCKWIICKLETHRDRYDVFCSDDGITWKREHVKIHDR